MKHSISLFLLTIIVSVTNLKSQEILFLQWGENDDEIGLRRAPDGQFGPMSFEVKENQIYILDSQNKKLKVFRDSQLIDSYGVPSRYVDDFAWFSRDRIYLLEHNKVYRYNNDTATDIIETESPDKLVTGLQTIDSDLLVTLNRSSSVRPAKRKVLNYTENRGIEDGLGNMVLVQKQSPGRISISSGVDRSFDIISDKNDLGMARYLGTTPSGDIYIYLEKISRHIPLSVERKIYLYSNKGEVKRGFDVPLHMNTYVFSEFHVDEQGNLYHMITSEDGVHIFARYLNDKSTYSYSKELQKLHHYNTIETGFPPDGSMIGRYKAATEFDTINREESLAIGDTYVQHDWIAEAANITNGRIHDPNGVEIETPSWIVEGVNSKVPYKWGGFNTIDGFETGLQNGKYSGDKATSGVSSYCVGVDCSGFVSRCWKLPSHYSTRMMDDFITVAYDSWDKLQPADIIHKPGHVRLFVSENPDGSLLVVEASGADWRVSYRSYNLSQLYNYMPRYYIYAEGSPAVLPHATMSSLIRSDSVYINWKLDRPDPIAGFRLYVNKDGNNWINEQDNELMSASKRSLGLGPTNEAPVFYKLTCISDENDLLEGSPTDVYGYYSGGSSRVLIVDGFDRIDGSYNLDHHDFVKILGESLAINGISFESVSNDALVEGSVGLENYETVFWILGDESTEDETFSYTEQELVIDFLQQGGNIFISGSEIAWDLDNKGSSSDKTFINNFLKVRYDQDDSQDYIVSGTPGTVFEGVTVRFDNGTHGIYEEDYPDSYLTNDESYPAMNYSNGLIAATAYTGTLSGGTAPAKVIVMGFPFETIYQADERNNLTERLLIYFGLISSAGIAEGSPYNDVVLFDNYPNPFSLNTTIKLKLKEEQLVNLEIFDLNGRKMGTLVSEKLGSGTYDIHMDADELPDGVYYYAVSTSGGFYQAKKMVVLH